MYQNEKHIIIIPQSEVPNIMLLILLQIQFTSKWLKTDMFKVSNGAVRGLNVETNGLKTEFFKNNARLSEKTPIADLSPDGYM